MPELTSQQQRAVRRIGHKGADHVSPGNTFESFQAALDLHVDMIEFDVISERPDGSGERLLANGFLVEGPTWAPNGRVLMYFRQQPNSSGRAGSVTLN